ncbi:metallophosphoesterase, partial [Streptomyces ipomoeae]|nr:metallophosphoesterase [Streptomyces ipomoeae]
MVIVFILVAVLVLAVFAALHWYAWRRLVRDTTRGPGLARRVGTGVFIAGPVLMVAGFAAERGGAPFWLQRTLTWPGFMWLAFALYLLLALLVGELVRPLVRRLVERRAPAPAERPEPAIREPQPEPEPVPAGAKPTTGSPPCPFTHLQAPRTEADPLCRLLLEKKKKNETIQ